ncbi:5-methylthioribose kinase [Paenibacillus tundrae]|uniref:5-methylthioribose kinase n=1 Tax=Paenibacillus tundrae TaxID=528187 RepID=A0ABT9WK40_9BACL|nr:5-methylthioribose kinase [Paenibacillus tundrae]
MNSQLKRTIDQVKELLMQDHDSIIYGQLHSGLGYTLPSDCPHMRPYYDFLGMSNGALWGD